MTTTPLPPLPEVGYLGDDASYGYNARDMTEYATAARADLETEVQRLKQAAEELSFLYGDLLLWTEWAVDKGNANSDLEEAWERYEEWLKARAALKETP